MEQWAEIRRRVLTGEISKREACREYELHWQTLQKILAAAEPPPFRTKVPRAKPRLGPFLPIIHQILEADRTAPPKQRHTAERIFQRLRDEHGYTGCSSIVRAAVHDWRRGRAEVFVPLAHPPGEAQVDFGHAEVVIAGERVKAAYFVLTLPYSDAFFVRAFPKECTESFQDGHVRAFDYFGGVPTRISYDNSKIAVAAITGRRGRTRPASSSAWPAISCSPTGSVESGGRTRRGTSRPWSGSPAATSWSRSPKRSRGRRSTPSWSGGARPI
jgi:transposase